eukprot:Colp12_sorted_trinity150504_noHs@2570
MIWTSLQRLGVLKRFPTALHFRTMATPVKKERFEFFRDVLKSPKYVVAPMVDQSELAWRLLSRKYGADLCYTPMFHAGNFARDASYRAEQFTTCPEDRPLIVQFCANDPETLLKAAKYVEDQCDAVDLNLGCPQQIAKRGHYGAFLQDDWDTIAALINILHTNLKVPVTAKIRVFPELDKTIAYAKMIVAAGAQLLTVHGRTRDQIRENTGLANWEYIKAIREAVDVPVIANGNILYYDDVDRCIAETGVNGVMSSEGNLHNPSIFLKNPLPVWTMVDDYLEFAKNYTTNLSAVRGHLFKLYRHCLTVKPEYRDPIAHAHSLEELTEISMRFNAALKEAAAAGEEEYWMGRPYVRPLPGSAKPEKPVEEVAQQRLERKQRREEKRQARRQKRESVMVERKEKPRKKWEHCVHCTRNPAGLKCEHALCRACCKVHCVTQQVVCVGHHFSKRVGPATPNNNTEECMGGCGNESGNESETEQVSTTEVAQH